MLDGKLIERHVLVEGVDDPIAPEQHLPRAVHVIAAGVAEASEVEPKDRHLLAIARRCEHSLDELLVSIGGFVREELIDFLQIRRQAAQIERQSADHRHAVGRRRRLEPRFL